jgi:predicted nucleic acid-binding protein
MDRTDAERVKQIVMGNRHLSAREAVHLAVMEHHGMEAILTFDSGERFTVSPTESCSSE